MINKNLMKMMLVTFFILFTSSTLIQNQNSAQFSQENRMLYEDDEFSYNVKKINCNDYSTCLSVLDFLVTNQNVNPLSVQQVTYIDKSPLDMYRFFIKNQNGNVVRYKCSFNKNKQRAKILTRTILTQKNNQNNVSPTFISQTITKLPYQTITKPPCQAITKQMQQKLSILTPGNIQSADYSTNLDQYYKHKITITKNSNKQNIWYGKLAFKKQAQTRLQFDISYQMIDRVRIGIASKNQLKSDVLSSRQMITYDGYDSLYWGQTKFTLAPNFLTKQAFGLTTIKMVVTTYAHWKTASWFNKNGVLLGSVFFPTSMSNQVYLKLFIQDQRSTMVVRISE